MLIRPLQGSLERTKRPPLNIYVVGAQCTSKTTLVSALETFLANIPGVPHPIIIRELARSVNMENHDFVADDITSSTERCMSLQILILGH
jgi:hypothetical protein